MRPRAIVWDWDNTLADGWAAVTLALNQAFAAFDLPAWSEAETRNRARHSVRESFPPIFGPDWKRAAAIFGEAYRSTHMAAVRPLPGVPALLRTAGHLPMAVISNKEGDFVRRECTALGFDPHFRAVFGAGDAAADKPHHAAFALALEAISEPAGSDIWYVGDTGLDMQAARAWGCTAVLLGDAAHDGGVNSFIVPPDLHFVDADALSAYLQGSV
jgi:phosphoglycolate phosphatase